MLWAIHELQNVPNSMPMGIKKWSACNVSRVACPGEADETPPSDQKRYLFDGYAVGPCMRSSGRQQRQRSKEEEHCKPETPRKHLAEDQGRGQEHREPRQAVRPDVDPLVLVVEGIVPPRDIGRPIDGLGRGSHGASRGPDTGDHYDRTPCRCYHPGLGPGSGCLPVLLAILLGAENGKGEGVCGGATGTRSRFIGSLCLNRHG